MALRCLSYVTTLLVVVLLSTPVLAASKTPDPPGFTLTPSVGGILFSGTTAPKATLLYGIKLGYDINGRNIADSLGIEGTFNYFSTKAKQSTPGTSGNIDGYLLRLDTIYLFTPGKTWVPFAAFGLGAIETNDTQQTLHTLNGEKDLLINYGLGIKYFYENYLAFRVDARQMLIYRNVNTRNAFELTAGLTYLFGKEHKKKVPKTVMPTGPAVPILQDENLQEPGKGATSPNAPGAPAKPGTPAAPTPAAPGAAPASPGTQAPPTTPAGSPTTTAPAATGAPAAPQPNTGK